MIKKGLQGQRIDLQELIMSQVGEQMVIKDITVFHLSVQFEFDEDIVPVPLFAELREEHFAIFIVRGQT